MQMSENRDCNTITQLPPTPPNKKCAANEMRSGEAKRSDTGYLLPAGGQILHCQQSKVLDISEALESQVTGKWLGRTGKNSVSPH